MHKKKFKDPLSSTCQVSSERRVLDLESEVHERPGFYPLSFRLVCENPESLQIFITSNPILGCWYYMRLGLYDWPKP